jgi:hypothetical protein
MAETTLTEVDWFDPDFVYSDGTLGKPRLCDVCDASYSDDVPNEIRKFYRDDAEHMIVCEHCLPAYLAEESRHA